MTSLAITKNLKAIESHHESLEREIERLRGELAERDAAIATLSQSVKSITTMEKLAELFDLTVMSGGARPAIELIERAIVRRALIRSRGNQRKAALELCMSRNTVARYAK